MRPIDKPPRIWRRASTDLTVCVPGAGPVRVPDGAWVESTVFRWVFGAARKTLGPTFADAQLERAIGHRPPAGQTVVDPDAARCPAATLTPAGARPQEAAAPPPAPPRAPESPVPYVVAHTWPTGPQEAKYVALVASHGAEFPPASIAECVRLLERDPSIDVAVPLHSIGHPICAPQSTHVPLSGQAPRTGALRLPSGRSPSTIAAALLSLPPASTPTVPDEIVACVVRASAGALLPGRDAFVTCLTAFAWVRPGAAPVASFAPTEAAVPTAALLHPVRMAVAQMGNPGPRVLFVAGGVGPVGGTQVVLNLVDALNDRGIAASFAHLHTGSHAHDFRCRNAPLALTPGELTRDVEDRLGWARGEPALVVATSFAAGKLVSGICEKRPHWRPVAWWQDREDLFERPDNRPPHPSEFTDFLAISRAVAVSRWVAETARTDLGVGADFRVINPTVDPDFHRRWYSSRTASRHPCRVLAMWRPMTATRRGMQLLRETYEAVAKHYKGKKGKPSLEVFGWTEDVPKCVAVSHGHLTTEGVAALMQRADVVVEPSLYQGFGLPGLEALASGAVLVSTACRGVDEYALHERNALVVPHAELAAAVIRAIDGWQPLEPKIVNTWDNVAARWAALIEEWMP